MTGKGFQAYAIAVLLPANDHRQAAQPVPGNDQAVPLQQQKGTGAVNGLLRIADAIDHIVAPVDQRCCQLGGIDLTGGHSHKLMAGAGEGTFHQGFRIVDHTHRSQCEHPQMGADQQRLRVSIGNAADPNGAPHFAEICLKFCAERRILNVVDLPLKAAFLIVEHQTGTAGAQMRMIIRSKENIVFTILAGNRPEKTTHISIPPRKCTEYGSAGEGIFPLLRR